MTKKIILIVFVGMFLLAGMARADDLPEPGMLPGHPLYFLKSWGENIGTLFTFGEIPRAERYMFLAEKRLAEARALMEENKSEIAKMVLERHQEQINKALNKAEQARQKGLDVDEVLAKVSEATLRHQGVLIEVYEKVPEEARSAIERAMEKGMRGHWEALEAISGEKREEMREGIETKTREMLQKVEEVRGRGIPIPEIIPPVLIEDFLPEPLLPDDLPEELPIEVPGVPGGPPAGKPF